MIRINDSFCDIHLINTKCWYRVGLTPAFETTTNTVNDKLFVTRHYRESRNQIDYNFDIRISGKHRVSIYDTN